METLTVLLVIWALARLALLVEGEAVRYARATRTLDLLKSRARFASTMATIRVLESRAQRPVVKPIAR